MLSVGCATPVLCSMLCGFAVCCLATFDSRRMHRLPSFDATTGIALHQATIKEHKTKSFLSLRVKTCCFANTETTPFDQQRGEPKTDTTSYHANIRDESDSFGTHFNSIWNTSSIPKTSKIYARWNGSFLLAFTKKGPIHR